MTTTTSQFSPGSLVHCRQRDWVVLPSPDPQLLLLRPLGGDSEISGVFMPLSSALGADQVTSAIFPLPDPALAGDHTAGRLLRDAARLNFRSGAGPFRSLGRISVRPRPFQLVPLLMALRLRTVRLLIADDVGVGKTVEAALIARELLDRGEARRLCVLCPPHLCDQWQRELAEKFNLDAVVIRSSTVAALERTLLDDRSVFEIERPMVVSIDLVKSERWRHSFLRGCPDLVIVDEVHTAARAGGSPVAQQRHALLREVARDERRHLLLLTATPHSGLEDAFRSLLELLDPAFASLDIEHLAEAQRRELARHFVQRRRADVQKWLGPETPFPSRETRNVSYSLSRSPEYRRLFDDVYAFARELVRGSEGGRAIQRQRVRYWAALALLRCVMSSPAAAQATFNARLVRTPGEEGTGDMEYAQYVLDIGGQEVGAQADSAETPVDFEPAQLVEDGEGALEPGERGKLRGFLKRAAALRGDADPKLVLAVAEIEALLREGFHPIVYCRYIATAEYVAAELAARLRKRWPELEVFAVTGLSSEDERDLRVAELEGHPRRVLVATDCLSEGINLQRGFDAVLHYDLPWNPNRLEQREGRVDRFGQAAPVVRALMLYGADNPIDQAVIDVLLRKARSIHKDLGIIVPLPISSESVVDSLVRRVFLEGVQLRLGEDPAAELAEVDRRWDEAVDREKTSRTRFAQHAIRPEEVARELAESDLVLGDPATVALFVRSAAERLQAPLASYARLGEGREVWRLPLAELPPVVIERAGAAFASGRRGKTPAAPLIGFEGPLPEDVELVVRTHPLTEALAEYLLSSALEPGAARPEASRCGASRCDAVERRTTLLLLRLRLLIAPAAGGTPQLAEELVVKGFAGRPDNLEWLDDDVARQLLDKAEPVLPGLDADRRSELLAETLEWLPELQPDLVNVAEERAAELLRSHNRVRLVTNSGAVTVRPNLPLDVLGIYVLMPVPKGVKRA